MKVFKGCIVRHPGIIIQTTGKPAVLGKGRLYRVKKVFLVKFYSAIKQKVVIQRWATIRSLKKPRWQLKSQTCKLILVREP